MNYVSGKVSFLENPACFLHLCSGATAGPVMGRQEAALRPECSPLREGGVEGGSPRLCEPSALLPVRAPPLLLGPPSSPVVLRGHPILCLDCGAQACSPRTWALSVLPTGLPGAGQWREGRPHPAHSRGAPCFLLGGLWGAAVSPGTSRKPTAPQLAHGYMFSADQ